MNINLIKFQILEELYKSQKITTVAQKLNLKQPTITFHLKAMEKEFKVKLFENRYGKIFLTEAGEALYHYAVKINALTLEAARVVKEYEHGKGTIKIGASYVPATYLLPRILSNYSQENPKLSFSLKVKTAPAVLSMLQNREIDVCIISSEPFELSNVMSKALLKDDMVVFFSKTHPLAGEPCLNTELLKKSSLIIHGENSTTRNITLKWLNYLGIKIDTLIELDSLEAIKHIVLLGQHISVISRLAIKSELTEGSLLCHEIPSKEAFITQRNIYYAINLDRKSSSSLTNFIDYLSNIAITK